MAPILSKAPPRTSQQKIERWVTRARPMLDSIFDVMKDFGTMGNMCKKDAESLFDKIRVKMDSVCIGCVRLLESLCCLDLNRFAKPEKPLTGSLPILFVLMLVVMLYNAFVFGYMPAAGIALNSSTSLTFHAWIFLLLASFAQAVRTDPGSTPSTPKWSTYGNPPPEARERKRGNNEARWCRKSNAYKPDRAHYCRVLNKGVLRMDHYCPWLGNTVGFHNQKFFFLFLLYTNAACAQLGISFLQLLVQYTLPALTTFCLVGAEGLTLLIGSLLVPFFLFHIFLIGRNTTTIEFCEKLRDKSDCTEGTSPLNYDMGIFANFQSVLGSNPLTWLFPVGGPPGDGINFPINPDPQESCNTSHPQVSTSTTKASKVANEMVKTLLSDSDACHDPEDTHPAACGSSARDASAGQTEGEDIKNGTGPAQDREEECAEEGEEKEENQVDEEEEEEEEEACSDGGPSGSVASEGGNDGGFLVWRDSAEFVEDLTIGFQYIAEKTEDCGRGSLVCLLTACIPGWGKKAARGLPGTRQKHALPNRVFPKRGRSRSPAVRVVLSEGPHEDGEGDSCSSGNASD